MGMFRCDLDGIVMTLHSRSQLILCISGHSASHLLAVLYIVLPRHPKQLVLRLLECSLAD